LSDTSSPEHLSLSIFFHNRDRPCFNPAMSSISEGFVLRKVTSFAAPIGLILATIAKLPHSASAANRSGLWVVVHDICVPAYQSIGVGFPCAEVSIADGLERGFAVLRAPSSATHVIVVPTALISGIESPALLREMRQTIGRPHGTRAVSSRKGRAVNCRVTRSEWRLIRQLAAARTNCIFMLPASPRRSLRSCAATKRKIHEAWSFLSSGLLGHRFAAMKVETDSLAHVDPFKLLARGLPLGKFSLGSQHWPFRDVLGSRRLNSDDDQPKARIAYAQASSTKLRRLLPHHAPIWTRRISVSRARLAVLRRLSGLPRQA
jgi:CDP-diacylglycerol pyrophosphatase